MTRFLCNWNGAGMLTAVELTKVIQIKNNSYWAIFADRLCYVAAKQHAAFGEIEAHFDDSLGSKQFELGFKSKEY